MIRKNSGISLLEFVVTLPFTFLFLFGASDILRAMNAQSAVDSATENALRCLSPINGNCASEAKDSLKRKYDVYEIQSDPMYLIDRYKFSATANFLSAPKYETKVLANVLDTADVELPTFKTRFVELGYDANISSSYFQMTQSLPKIQGDAINLDSQTFVFKNEQGKKVSPQVNNTSEFTLTVKKGEKQAKKTHDIEFQIDAPQNCDASLPCFMAKDIDKKEAGNDDYLKNCTQAFSWNDGDKFGQNGQYAYSATTGNMDCKKTPILLFIKGDKKIGKSDSAKVEISLIDKNGKVVRDLGGRVYNKDASASFVTRGASKDYYSDDLQKRFGDAEIAYHQAIQINYNQPYKIRFSMKSFSNKDGIYASNEDSTWIFKNLKVFAPKYTIKAVTAKCQDLILLSKDPYKNILNACNPENLTSKQKEKLTYTLNITGKGTKSNNFISSLTCDTQKATIQNVIKENNFSANFENNFVEDSLITCDETKKINVKCPENYGAIEKEDYETACPIMLDTYIFANGTTPKISYNKIKKEIQSVNWIKENCNDKEENHLNANYKNYKEHFISSKKTGENFKNLSSIASNFCENLKDIKESNDFKCNDFSFTSQAIEVDPKEANQMQTLLEGTHDGKQCSWENDGWKNILKSEITSNWEIEGINTACFEVNMMHAGKRLTNLTPSDNCISYTVDSNSSKENNKLLGTFEEGKFPSECDEAGKCKFVFNDFIREEAIEEHHRKEKSLQNAEVVAMHDLNELLPNAMQNCDSAYCVKFEGKEDKDNVHFTSKIKIPLYTLLGKTIEITSSAFKEKERF